VTPPEIPANACWDDLTPFQQANIIAFDQIASHDEVEQSTALAGGRAKPSQGKK